MIREVRILITYQYKQIDSPPGVNHETVFWTKDRMKLAFPSILRNFSAQT